MAMVASSIDDLFRQKPLNEIHSILRQTRDEVESKKQELRELVGDHYRSVLDSSDHIRAMSECAAKVAKGAERVEELIASMRQLATNPPGATGGGAPAPMRSSSRRPANEDPDYRLGLRIMELLEVPETVRSHLGAHEFVLAARVALLDASALQGEVGALLKQADAQQAADSDVALTKSTAAVGAKARSGAVTRRERFDFAALMKQQASTFRSLPRQIVASCVDAFATAALDPSSAGQSFVVHLLLEASLQPVPLLRLFVSRRTELIRSMLDCSAGGAGTSAESLSCGARMAAAAMAYEGTVVLSCSLCEAGHGPEPQLLKSALTSVLEGVPESSAEEERAAIEGRLLDAGGPGAFRRRVDSLGALLRQGGPGGAGMSGELANLGSSFASEWAASGPSDAGRSLSSRFGRLIAAAPGGQLSTCEALGGMLNTCTEKIMAYRHTLSGRAQDSWSIVWADACRRFCPGQSALTDALAIVTATVEAACGAVVHERVTDLQLELAPASEEDGDAGNDATEAVGGSSSSAASVGDAERREEIRDIQRQCHARALRFDEQFGEVVEDLEHVSRGGVASSAITAALLAALAERLKNACDQVRLPDVRPLWPFTGDSKDESSRPQWPVQRSAARAAIAFDTLLSIVTTDAQGLSHSASASTHLQKCIRTALSSGDAALVARAHAIQDELKSRSSQAFAAWARLAISVEPSCSTLASFWRLANEEVPKTCGWGDAKFATDAAQSQGEAKAIPVPVQASPFIFERLTLGARRALEVSSGSTAMPEALVAAVKTALGESLMSAYEAMQPELPSADAVKRSGMFHYLQWLFDLQFLRLALSSPAQSGSASVNSSCAAYQALTNLLDKTEAAALSDPVDRTLYQPVLKASVKNHVQGVRILFAPFFLHNPLYGVFFPSSGSDAASVARPSAAARGSDGDGFDIQATFAPPLRPTLPRFPLLPVANASALAHVSSAELDARLGLSADSAERAAARAAASAGAAGAGTAAVSSLTQSVGSALGSLGLGKAWPPLGSNWASSWGASAGGPRPPEAV